MRVLKEKRKAIWEGSVLNTEWTAQCFLPACRSWLHISSVWILLQNFIVHIMLYHQDFVSFTAEDLDSVIPLLTFHFIILDLLNVIFIIYLWSFLVLVLCWEKQVKTILYTQVSTKLIINHKVRLLGLLKDWSSASIPHKCAHFADINTVKWKKNASFDIWWDINNQNDISAMSIITQPERVGY